MVVFVTTAAATLTRVGGGWGWRAAELCHKAVDSMDHLSCRSGGTALSARLLFPCLLSTSHGDLHLTETGSIDCLCCRCRGC